MKGLISINGKICDPQNAVLSPLDRGFLFGDNVFEVFVAFHGKIIDLKEHLDRLRFSADLIKLQLPWTDEELEFELKSIAEHSNFPKAYIRLVVTRGEGVGIRAPEAPSPNRLIYCFPATIEQPRIYQDGVKLKLKSLNFTERGPNAKTGNYLRSITAIEDARKDNFDDILWANSDGEITESSTSNIFLIGRDQEFVEIATPPASSGILLGITREKIIDLLTRSQIKATIRTIYKDEIPRFDEAFLCSTVRGLIPIKKIDAHIFHTTRPSSVYHNIARLFMTSLRVTLGMEVEWNTGERKKTPTTT